MNPKLISQLKEIVIIPVAAAMALALFSLTLGWNALTLLLFWFILIPIIANTLPTLIAKNDLYPKQAIIGLIIFYGCMVFMIYEHYQTDYFRIMMISLISNILLVLFVTWVRKQNKLADAQRI